MPVRYPPNVGLRSKIISEFFVNLKKRYKGDLIEILSSVFIAWMANSSILSLSLSGAYSDSPIFCGKYGVFNAFGVAVRRSFGQFLYAYSGFSIANSQMTNFVSRAVKLSSKIGDLAKITTRQILSSSANITHTTFINITGGDYGGAICSSGSYSLQVSNCVFLNVTSSNEGAAIYQYGGTFTLLCSYFKLVHSTNTNDGTGANSFSAFSCTCFVNDTQIFNCWVTTTGAADSIYRFSGDLITLRRLNITECCEQMGGCCGEYISPIAGCSVEYITGLRNNGYTLIPLWYSPMGISYSNFINNSVVGCEFWAQTCTLSITFCSIFGSSSYYLYSYNANYVFSNCVGDSSAVGIAKESAITTFVIQNPEGCLPDFDVSHQFTSSFSRKYNIIMFLAFGYTLMV